MKQYILLALAAVALACCAQEKPAAYNIHATLDTHKFDGQMAYLKAIGDKAPIDSAKIADASFTFKGQAAEPILCQVALERGYNAILVAEQGDIHLALAYGKPATPSGTKLNAGLCGIIDEEMALSQAAQALTSEAQEDSLVAAATKRCKELMSQHSDDVLGEYMLTSLMYQVAKEEDQAAIVGMAGPKIAARPLAKKLKAGFDAVAATAAGKHFIDLEGLSPEGKAVRLSDYAGKGKYVLMDMWASWCGPCKGEIPNLRKAREMYKGKVEVVGIFVWDKQENLPAAIKSEGITWPQIFDAPGDASKKYGVQGIPQIMLIAPDGTIVERNLRGERIFKLLAEKVK